MRLVKISLKVFAVIIILFLVAALLFFKNISPTYQGELSLNGLTEEVEVFYDDYGIPHIYAQNEMDARRALGYVHAQDRLWQMELVRRIAAGRLSEIFGEKLIRTDKFFSGLGIEEAAQVAIDKLDRNSEAYELTIAYLDGVNQFIDEGPSPIEYYMLGIDKEKFTIKDVYNVFGYMAFSFAIAHKTDPLMTEIYEELGPAYLNDLDITINESSTLIKNEKNGIIESQFAQAINEIYDALPISPFIGSNSWVIGPEKTKNDKVLFANDPHIAFAQPSVWYQSHMITPEYEMYGYNLALTPFPLLAHNRKYAYGLTMLANDDVDFYFEEDNPDNENEYKTPEGYEPYEIRRKELKVKDAPTIRYDIKVSKHGPVMNDIIEHINDKRPIAMYWVYTQLPNMILDVGYKISHANSLNEFKEGASMVHAPGLNIMYGDADNNIAWFASGKLYKFANQVNTKLISNGSNGLDDQKTYIDFSENPQAINPSWHYVYSANNQPDSTGGLLYPGYYQPEDRAKRIVELLEARNDFTKEDVMAMINDVTSAVAPGIVQDVINIINREEFTEYENEVIMVLNDWDGSYELKSIGPTIYTRFIYEFLVSTYQDELGPSFKQFINTPVQKKNVAVQISRDSSVWWDDINTKEKVETRKDILTRSLKNTIKFLENQLGKSIDQWSWERVHSIEFKHSIGEVPALRKYFNVGPFASVGGKDVINNLMYNLDSTGYYKVHSGPSTRRVIDFSDIENSMSISPTGQSGNPLSKHYEDQAEKYNRGEFVKMMLNENEIKANKNKLVLKPK